MTIIGGRAFLTRSTRAAGLGALATAPGATLLATAPSPQNLSLRHNWFDGSGRLWP